MTLADKLIKHAANVNLPDGLAIDLLAAAEAVRRYQWLRTAGAWESEIGMEMLRLDPDKFDAEVDAAMKATP